MCRWIVFKMKKKLILPNYCGIFKYCITIPLLIEVANAAYIFSDGFESGNLNAWTVTYGTLSINSQTVNSGFYSVESIAKSCNIENLYYHVLGGSLPNPIYLREYVYINSTSVPSTNGDYYEVGGFSLRLAATTAMEKYAYSMWLERSTGECIIVMFITGSFSACY